MLSSGFRRAFATIARHPSSSKEDLDHSTDESDPKHAQHLNASSEWSISEDGVLLRSSASGNEWQEGKLGLSRGKQMPESTYTEKLLPGIPVQDSLMVDLNSSRNPTVSDFFLKSSRQPHVQSADAPPVGEGAAKATANPNVSDSSNQVPIIHVDKPPSNQETGTLRAQRSRASFHPFLHKLAAISATDTETIQDPLSTATSSPHTHISESSDDPSTPYLSKQSPQSTSPTTPPPKSMIPPASPSPSASEDDEQELKNRRRKRPQNTFSMLQPIVESGDNFSPSPKPSTTGSAFSPSILGLDNMFARKMEETGRLRRLQSQKNLNSNPGGVAPQIPPPMPSQNLPTLEKQQNGIAHVKARSEGHLPAAPSPKEPKIPSHPPSNDNQTKQSNGQAEVDQAALYDLLDQTQLELDTAKEEIERVIAQNKWEKLRLVEELKAAKQEALTLSKENEAQKLKLATRDSQLKNTEKDLNALMKEKRSWQEQLDTMHHRLNQAERQVRCLDHLTRYQLEARQEGIYGPTKRTKKASSVREPSTEVVSAVGALNEEILQTANLLVECLERTKIVRTMDDLARAKAVLGNKVTSMIQMQANDNSKGFRFLLMQVVLEVFMVHWCTNIIEGWYPKQRSFADLLIEMSAKTTTYPSGARVDCGKVQILQTGTTSPILHFPEWAADILKDLGGILSVAGLRMRPNKSSVFTSKFLTLVKITYDVRTALAEKDICGDLELSVVGNDMPFQTKWMEEAHAISRKQVSATISMQMEAVAGTCGMGLQRRAVNSAPGASEQSPTVVLKPKVVLARVLEESP